MMAEYNEQKLFLKKHDNNALVWKDTKIKYEILFNKISIYSQFTFDLQNKKVAIFSENRLEWVYALYSGWFHGNIVIPIDFMSTPEEVAYILKDSEPDIIFCSKNSEETLRKALDINTIITKVHLFEDINENTIFPEITEFPKSNMEDTALIIYTSGTTGSPKGVMLSFGNLYANIYAVSEHSGIYHSKQNVLVLLPLHHVLPLLGSVIATLYVGATCTFTPSIASEVIAETLANNPVSIIIGVPRFYSALRRGIKSKIDINPVARILFSIAEKLNSKAFSKKVFSKVHDKIGQKMEYLVCGGAAIEEEVAKDYRTLGFELLVGYGMTETAPMITFPRPGEVVINSSGKPLPNSEVKIIDGEVTITGPQVMQGYYNRPEETAQVIKNGRLYTGDLGDFDKDMNLFITGRRKEILVNAAGKNINPVEIEFKIQEQSREVKEIGVYLEDDMLKAIIFPDFYFIKSNGVFDIESHLKTNAIENYNLKVSPYKRIRNISIAKEELPKTRLGKLKRHELSTLAEIKHRSENKSVAEPDTMEYELIRDYLKAEKKRDIYPNDHIELDVGLDSLDTVGFIEFIKSTFGIELKPEQIIDSGTVSGLAEYIAANKVKMEYEAVKWSEIFNEELDMNLPSSWFTHNLIKHFASLFMKSYFRIKGEGMDKLPESPFILAPNHQSFFDGLFVGIFLKNKTFKRTYFYAKKKHVNKKFRKFLADTNNVIVVDINNELKQSLQKMAVVLKKGKNIIIFPEGTRSRDGKLGDFKKTFAILSRELKVPIVPVAIDGAYNALPRGTHFPKPFTKIKVKFLDPVYPENHTYDNLKDNVRFAVSNALKITK